MIKEFILGIGSIVCAGDAMPSKARFFYSNPRNERDKKSIDNDINSVINQQKSKKNEAAQ